MSLNKVMLIGNLGRDPEMRYTPNGQPVTTFSVAVNRRWKDKQGEWQDETEWFNCQSWGPLAERVAEYIRKGNKVFCEGRMKTEKWESEGQQKSRMVVVCTTLQSLEKRATSSDAGGGEAAAAPSDSDFDYANGYE